MVDIIYRVMIASDLEAVRTLNTRTFVTEEPILKNLNVDKEKTSSLWIDAVFPLAVAGGVSVVAVDSISNNIVGFRLTTIDYKNKPNVITFPEDDPAAKGISLAYGILGCLHKGQDLFSKYDVDCVAHYVGLTVAKSHQKQGIAKKLVEKSLELIKEKGIKLVVVEATSLYSQKVFQKLGFEELTRILYETLVEDGKLTMTEELRSHYMMALCAKQIQ